MSNVSATVVKELREETGLPLMDCKNALVETKGDKEAAKVLMRERGLVIQGGRSGRETAFGRFGIYASLKPGQGGMVELKCESAPVTQHEEFIQLANDLAQQLATGPGAATADELLSQPSPSKKGMTLGDQKDDLFNRIREVFKVGRIKRIDGACGGYSHNSSTVAGVLIEVDGGKADVAKDISMHIAAMSPAALNIEDLDKAEVDKERKILREAALNEGKPENIVDKMVEGRLRNFYAERVLNEQAFVKEQKVSVGEYAKQNGMKIKQFVHWVLGQE